MATPLKALSAACRVATSLLKKENLSFIFRRNILSPAYKCTDAWKKSLESQSFGEISLSEFAVQMQEQLDKFGHVSAVDVNIFAHQFEQLDGDEEEAEFVEDILKRYNRCQESYPPCPSTGHALVRGYIAAGLTNRLTALLSDRLTYGVYPDFYTLNLLIDHFLEKEDYAHAASVAYYSTLQEDFTDPLNLLLSLQACVNHLATVEIEDISPAAKEESDGEEDWVKVKYIKFPFYDDHFDIKDQRFLLGKTLMMLSEAQAVDIPKDIRTGLKVIGAGLYHKFDQGIAYLESILGSSDLSISQQSLDYFHDSLQRVQSRDSDEPEVEIALRTVDDEIHKQLPLHEEKEKFVSEFGRLKERLFNCGKIKDDVKINGVVNEFVKCSIPEHEQRYIDEQPLVFQTWRENQDVELDKQLFELQKKERIEEMRREVRQLQEQEELLEYFDREEAVRLAFMDDDAQQSHPHMSITKI